MPERLDGDDSSRLSWSSWIVSIARTASGWYFEAGVEEADVDRVADERLEVRAGVAKSIHMPSSSSSSMDIFATSTVCAPSIVPTRTFTL